MTEEQPTDGLEVRMDLDVVVDDSMRLAMPWRKVPRT